MSEISEANMREAEYLSRISRCGAHAVYDIRGNVPGVLEIAKALQSREDACNRPAVDVDSIAQDAADRCYTGMTQCVKGNGDWASSLLIGKEIIKTALLKARGEV